MQEQKELELVGGAVFTTTAINIFRLQRLIDWQCLWLRLRRKTILGGLALALANPPDSSDDDHHDDESDIDDDDDDDDNHPGRISISISQSSILI